MKLSTALLAAAMAFAAVTASPVPRQMVDPSMIDDLQECYIQTKGTGYNYANLRQTACTYYRPIMVLHTGDLVYPLEEPNQRGCGYWYAHVYVEDPNTGGFYVGWVNAKTIRCSHKNPAAVNPNHSMVSTGGTTSTPLDDTDTEDGSDTEDMPIDNSENVDPDNEPVDPIDNMPDDIVDPEEPGTPATPEMLEAEAANGGD